MKQFIVLCALVAVACGAWNGGLRAKFNIGLFPGRNHFYEVPTTVEDAEIAAWDLLDRPQGSPMPELVMYCAIERHLCALYDDMENVAGLQVAIPQDEHTDGILDWGAQGFSAWSPPPRDGEAAKTYWTLAQYFVSEESLKRSAESREEDRDDNQVLQEDGIWLTGFGKQLLKVSRNATEIENSIFTKQACIPSMGRHYYYNMSSTTPCTSDALYPWFPLVDDGQLVGTGFVSFGKLPIRENEKDWFERPNEAAVKLIVPSGPQCMYDMAGKNGLVTMHIYYVDRPWLIFCPLFG